MWVYSIYALKYANLCINVLLTAFLSTVSPGFFLSHTPSLIGQHDLLLFVLE